MAKLSSEQKGQFLDQVIELTRVTVNGTRPFEEVRRALQDIIEGKFTQAADWAQPSWQSSASQLPSWYVSPERQLENVRRWNAERSWGFSEEDFPSIPEFVPSTSTEVLLLAVYLPAKGRKTGLQRTFDEFWELAQVPDGYTKWRWDGLKADGDHLRQVLRYGWQPDIRWVAFDPNAHHKLSPEDALKRADQDGSRLAGVEVLMAVVHFPKWATSWNGDSSPYPNMSGLQFYWNADWSLVPYVGRWHDGRQLELYVFWADYASPRWASPVVREILR